MTPTRRDVLAWTAAVALSLKTGWRAYAQSGTSGDTGDWDGHTGWRGGYGKDPDLQNLTAGPWPRQLGEGGRATAAALADIVLPGADGLPDPSALGIADFFDEWLSAPYPEQERDRDLLLDLFGWLDLAARQRGAASFAAAEPGLRADLVAAEAASGVDDASAFRRFTVLTVAAVYTTAEGIRAIGFVGNAPQDGFTGPPPDVLDRLYTAAEALPRRQNPED